MLNKSKIMLDKSKIMLDKSKIIIIFIIIGILVMFISSKNRTENFQEFDDLLLTDYKKRFVCSKWLDHLPKHVRLNNSGGIMYMSSRRPIERNCHRVECPSYISDDLTPLKDNIDHYNICVNNGNNDNYNNNTICSHSGRGKQCNLRCWKCQ